MKDRFAMILLIFTLFLSVGISGCFDLGSKDDDTEDEVPFYQGEWSVTYSDPSLDVYIHKFSVSDDGRFWVSSKNNDRWGGLRCIGYIENGSTVINHSSSRLRFCASDGNGEVVAQTKISINEIWTFDGEALSGRKVEKERVDIGVEDQFDPEFYAKLPSTKIMSWSGDRTSKEPV